MLRRRELVHHLCAALVLMAILALFYRSVIFEGHTFFTLSGSPGTVPEAGAWGYTGVADGTSAVMDSAALAWEVEPGVFCTRRMLRDGELPLWNPHSLLGQPQLGRGYSGVFDPLLIPLYLCPRSVYPAVSDAIVLLRYFLAGFFTYLFAKRLRLSFFSALFAGIVFMQSVYGMLYGDHPSARVYEVMPMVLYGFERSLQRPGPRSVVVGACMVAWAFLADFAEATFLVLHLAILWYVHRALWHAVNVWRTKGLQPAGAAFAGLCSQLIHMVVIGCFLSAPLFLPFLENVSASLHVHDSVAGSRSLQPDWWLFTFIPPLTSIGGRATSAVYCYMAALLLAVVGALARPAVSRGRHITVFWAAVFVLYFGKQHGFWWLQWFGSLPGFSQIYLERYLTPLVEISIAVLAGFGVEALVSNAGPTRPALAALIVVLALMMYFMGPVNLGWWGNFEGLMPHLLEALAYLAVPLLLLLLCDLLKLRATCLGFLLCAQLVVETHGVWRSAGYQVRYDPFTEPPFVQRLRHEARPFRVFGLNNMLYPNTAMAYGLDDLRHATALVAGRAWPYVNRFISPFPETLRIVGTERQLKFQRHFDLLNVEYIIAAPRTPLDSLSVLRFDARPDLLAALSPQTSTQIHEVSLDGRTLRAISMTPPESRSLRFLMPNLGTTASLHLAVGIGRGQMALERNAARVDFRVSVSSSTMKQEVHSRQFDPSDVADDRGWVPVVADLSQFIGEEIELRFTAAAISGGTGTLPEVHLALPAVTFSEPPNLWRMRRLHEDAVDLTESFYQANVAGSPESCSLGLFDIASKSRLALNLGMPKEASSGGAQQGEYALRLPEVSATLHFYIGLDGPSLAGAGPVQFQLSVRSGGTVTPLFDRSIDPRGPASSTTWLEERLDLSAWRGRDVVLLLSAGGSSTPRPGTLGAWWADLRLEGAGLGALAAVGKGPQRSSRFTPIYDREAVIYRNENVYPRAFVVHRARLASSYDEALTMMEPRDFDPSERVILEGPWLTPWDPRLLATSTGPPPTSVGSIEQSTNRLKVRATLAQPGFLVASDSFFPGWEAYVDGVRVPIYPAYGLMRAVYLEVGAHEVLFVYFPWSLKLGLALAAIALVEVVLLLRRRPPAAAGEQVPAP